MEANLSGATVERAAEKIESLLGGESPTEPEAIEEDSNLLNESSEEESNLEPEESGEEESEDESEEEAETNSEEETWQLPESLDDLSEQLDVEAEELLNLGLKVKVNGEEQTVKLKDLRQSHMMEADYRQKTAELAEQRRALEEQTQAMQNQWTGRVQELESMTGAMEQQLLSEYQSVNWNELRANDPAEYSALQADYQSKANQIAQVKQNAMRQVQENARQINEKQSGEYQTYLQTQNELLSEKMPEWKEDRQGVANKITTYLKGQSFTDQELTALSDHRHLLIAQKAMLYDKLQEAKPGVKKKISKAPKLQKPGAKQSKGEVKNQKRGQLRKRLKNTGDVKDAASLFEDFM